MHITLTTLKKGAESLKIEFAQNITKKDLEAKIDETLSGQQLDYECPSCGKDIPDVEACPYCSESFTEDEDTNVKEETVIEHSDTELVIEHSDTETEDEAVQEETSSEVEVSEIQDTVAPEAGIIENKVEDKVEPKKEKASKKENTSKEYEELINAINEIAGQDIELRKNNSGITYLIDKKRIMKVASTSRSITIEFNVELTTENEDIKKFTPEEAKAKHLGTVRAIYPLGEVSIAIQLVKEAFEIKRGIAVEV